MVSSQKSKKYKSPPRDHRYEYINFGVDSGSTSHLDLCYDPRLWPSLSQEVDLSKTDDTGAWLFSVGNGNVSKSEHQKKLRRRKKNKRDNCCCGCSGAVFLKTIFRKIFRFFISSTHKSTNMCTLSAHPTSKFLNTTPQSSDA